MKKTAEEILQPYIETPFRHTKIVEKDNAILAMQQFADQCNMTNLEAAKRFDQAHGAYIEELFWIASSLNNDTFKDVLNDMDDNEFKNCFPEIYNSVHFKDYKKHNELGQALVDFRKFGLLAVINIPEADNFSYENGKPVSWSIHSNVCRIEYAYAESLEQLMVEIENVSEKLLKEYMQNDKKTIS